MGHYPRQRFAQPEPPFDPVQAGYILDPASGVYKKPPKPRVRIQAGHRTKTTCAYAKDFGRIKCQAEVDSRELYCFEHEPDQPRRAVDGDIFISTADPVPTADPDALIEREEEEYWRIRNRLDADFDTMKGK